MRYSIPLERVIDGSPLETSETILLFALYCISLPHLSQHLFLSTFPDSTNSLSVLGNRCLSATKLRIPRSSTIKVFAVLISFGSTVIELE